MSAEEIYDKEIAPLMQQIIEICKANRIPLVAQFELAKEGDSPDYCLTSLYPESAAMRMLHYMAKCLNNIDLFLIAVQRDKQLMEGNSSVYLHRFAALSSSTAPAGPQKEK